MKLLLLCGCICLILGAILANPTRKENKDRVNKPTEGKEKYDQIIDEWKHSNLHSMFGSPFIEPFKEMQNVNKMIQKKPDHPRKNKHIEKSKHQRKRKDQKSK